MLDVKVFNDEMPKVPVSAFQHLGAERKQFCSKIKKQINRQRYKSRETGRDTKAEKKQRYKGKQTDS